MKKIVMAALLVVSTSLFAAETKKSVTNASKRKVANEGCVYSCYPAENEEHAASLTNNCDDSEIVKKADDGLMACCPSKGHERACSKAPVATPR